MLMEKTVAVIGAGASGLQAARALLKHGFSVVVLEAEGHIGGAWSSHHAGAALRAPDATRV